MSRRSEKHYIYLIGDGEFVKVGYSVDPRRRLRSLQGASGRELTLIRAQQVKRYKRMQSLGAACAKNWETWLHKRLADWHVRGEWFDLECVDRALALLDHIDAQPDGVAAPRTQEGRQERRRETVRMVREARLRKKRDRPAGLELGAY